MSPQTCHQSPQKVKRLPKPKAKTRGKPTIYQNEAICKFLKEIWLKANLPCSKRLKVILPLWLPWYIQLFGQLSPDVTNALLKISPPTIDRLLRPIRVHYTKRGHSTTKPGTLLRKKIPLKPTNGINPVPDASKPIPSLSAESPPQEYMLTPSTLSISPPAGPNSEPSGERVKPAF